MSFLIEKKGACSNGPAGGKWVWAQKRVFWQEKGACGSANGRKKLVSGKNENVQLSHIKRRF